MYALQLAELAAASWRTGLAMDTEDEARCRALTQRLLSDDCYAARRAAASILPTLPAVWEDQVLLNG